MRIISGKNRATRLHVPDGLAIRPTADRVKESVFSIMGSVEKFSVLDLYAGTGNIGLESLSRGAVRAVFVDPDETAQKYIRKNIEKCRYALGTSGDTALEVLKLDAARAVEKLGRDGDKFDLIYVDPPWKSPTGFDDDTVKVYESILAAIAKSGILSGDGVIVSEHHKKTIGRISVDGTGLELADQRRYGDTAVSFYRVGSK